MEPPPVPNSDLPRDLTAKVEDEKPQEDSQPSIDSQTASDFINSQLQLEADAREALPYAFDSCTHSLGPLRQILFSCLTCHPPPESPSDPYTPAAVCYSCSIACHGEHTLVELFNKRNFVCDCGTTRLPSTSPCTLRANAETGVKGVHSEKAASGNKYNQNFQNRFCGCGEVYDAHSEKGTMFQCIGLGHVKDGGCGEDWWHPECIAGLRRDWHKRTLTTRTSTDKPESDQAEKPEQDQGKKSNDLPQDNQVAKPEQDKENKSNDPPEKDQVEKPEQDQEEKSDDPALPPGFPEEEDFEAFICYKCVESNSWIKRYAGTPGFLNAYKKLEHIDLDNKLPGELPAPIEEVCQAQEAMLPPVESSNGNMKVGNKRKFEDDAEDDTMSTTSKRVKEDGSEAEAPLVQSPACKYESLPKAPFETLSLFCKEDFRDHICHCPTHFPLLKAHPQLLEEEENYEPPISESGNEDAASGARSHGTGSLLDRGEAALGNVDRVRAIEGVMAYNHMRDKVKAFLAPFAESGQPVGAEDIKKYFEKLRGDEEGIRAAAADKRGGGSGGDNRREQSGY